MNTNRGRRDYAWVVFWVCLAGAIGLIVCLLAFAWTMDDLFPLH